MPSTRSRAETKCISDVPGFVKQTSTPPASNVLVRLSAPFIVVLAVCAVGRFRGQTIADGQPGSSHMRFRNSTSDGIAGHRLDSAPGLRWHGGKPTRSP